MRQETNRLQQEKEIAAIKLFKIGLSVEQIADTIDLSVEQLKILKDQKD